MRRESTVRGMAAVCLAFTCALAAAPAPAAAQDQPTYARDVAPIIQENCQVCHQPGSIAPMSLMTFEAVKRYAPRIREKVSRRLMPPWHIDRSVGIQEFKNDRALTDEELATLVTWLDSDMPFGDEADMPPAAEFSDPSAWQFEETFGRPPDLVVASEPYTLAAQTQDKWFTPTVATGLTKERWVKAIEIRPSWPDGPRVVHHALAFLIQQEDPDEMSAESAALTTSSRSMGGPGPLHGVGGRQGRRDLPRRGRQAHAPRFPDPVGGASARHRPGGRGRPRGARRLVLPGGRGSPEPDPPPHVQRHRRRTGHRARQDRGHPGLLPAPLARPARELPAPHAHEGQGHVDDRRLPRRPQGASQPGQRLPVELARQLHLRRPRRTAPPGRHHPHLHRLARQHRREPQQPRPHPVGRLGRPHRRRDGPRLGRRHLPDGRAVRGRGSGARGAGGRRGGEQGRGQPVGTPWYDQAGAEGMRAPVERMKRIARRLEPQASFSAPEVVSVVDEDSIELTCVVVDIFIPEEADGMAFRDSFFGALADALPTRDLGRLAVGVGRLDPAA